MSSETQKSQPQDFEAAKARLEEIANAVGDESLPLDEALDLFEEAVSLGLKVSDYLEEDVVTDENESSAPLNEANPESPVQQDVTASVDAAADSVSE